MKGNILVASILLSVAVSVNAQGFTDINAAITGLHYSDVAWGDYDNDGDLDLIIAGLDSGENGVTEIYRNDGNDTFVGLTALSLPGTYIGDIAWGDYDNDEDLDFLLQGYNNSSSFTALYENQGSDNFVNSGISFPGLADGSVSFVDFNNDGYTDVFMDGFDGTDLIAILYENDGIGGFTETTVSFHATMKSCYEWGDYDNDRDLDLFITGHDGSVLLSRLYTNNGDGTFSLSSNSFEGAWLGDATWGDYNSDGYLDLLVSGHANSGKIVALYKNQGDGTFAEVSGTGLVGVSHCSTIWGDYDNDGDLDVFIGGTYESSPSWIRVTDVFINNGDDTFTEAGLVFTNDSYWGESAWGDYDNDGDLDLVCSGYDDAGGSHTRIYRNEGTANTVPSTPGNLQHTVSDCEIVMSWDSSTDVETPSSGLYYNGYIRSTSGDFVWASMADISTGYRIIPALGNANQNTSWVIDDIPPGDYFWSVQALDNNFEGSLFATEESFTIVGQGMEGSSQNGTTIRIENFPDPFTYSTEISLNMVESGHTRVMVYGLDGRLVRLLADNFLTGGVHQLIWDGTDNSGNSPGSGIFFIKLEVNGGQAVVEKCTLIR